MRGLSYYSNLSRAIVSLSIALGCFFLVGASAFDADWDLYLGNSQVADRCQNERMSAVNASIGNACGVKRPEWIDRPFEHELKVFIDPGHGGKDRGAQGFFGISEKWLSLEISRQVGAAVEKAAVESSIPIRVRMSRGEDAYLSLHERVELANQWPADLFVSIHANWSALEKARGFEVYFLSHEASDAETRRLVQIENNTAERPIKSDILNILADVQNTRHIEESSYFAENVFRRLSFVAPPNGKGVRQGPFTVLSGTSMPSVLVEVGFVSNPIEANSLRSQDYLRSIAGAISSGIIDFARKSRSPFTS